MYRFQLLDEIFTSRAQVRVLRALFQSRADSGRQVAQRAGVAVATAKRALDALTAGGIVVRSGGPGKLGYAVCEEHYLAVPLHELFARERELPMLVGRRLSCHFDALSPGGGWIGYTVARSGTVEVVCEAAGALDRYVRWEIDEGLRKCFGFGVAAFLNSPRAIPERIPLWYLTGRNAEPVAMQKTEFLHRWRQPGESQ